MLAVAHAPVRKALTVTLLFVCLRFLRVLEELLFVPDLAVAEQVHLVRLELFPVVLEELLEPHTIEVGVIPELAPRLVGLVGGRCALGLLGLLGIARGHREKSWCVGVWSLLVGMCEYIRLDGL